MPFELQREGSVVVLRMEEDDNRFSLASLQRLHELLDEAEVAVPTASALVTTGDGKFFSNGFDVPLDGPLGPTFDELVGVWERLLWRTMLFPRPTIAALNGHCFAGAAVWSLAHDMRVMRADRGYWCLPEADIGVPFSDGALALVRSRLAPHIAHTAIFGTRRYGGYEAEASGIVDRAVPASELMATALDSASELAGKHPDLVRRIKTQLYGPVLAALGADV